MNDSPANEMDNLDSEERDRPEQAEATARTVEEAIELAIRQLDVRRAEAEVEVLTQGKSGFLGFGAEMARVRATRLQGAGTLAQHAKGVVDRILEAMGVSALSTIGKAPADSPQIAFVEITGEDSGLLIGRRGETLRALQFVVNQILRNQSAEEGGRLLLDVEQYRQRRNRVLRGLALRMADRVASSGRAITLEPMPPGERRAIHVALADNPGVQTVSEGDGDQRKVSIRPRRPGGQAEPRPPRPPAGDQG